MEAKVIARKGRGNRRSEGKEWEGMYGKQEK